MMELTKQEFQNECLFSVTMSHVRSMLQNDLISQNEYFQMRNKMRQKYHPVSDGLITETDLQATENRGLIRRNESTVKRTFEWTRTYASQSKGLKAGDKDNITKTVYLHFFFSSQRKVNEDAALKRIIMEAKAEIEQGISIDTLKKPVRDLVKKCCDITYDKAGNAKVIFTDEGFEDACKYHGIFMIVTKRNNGTFDTLSWYRKREEIKDFFRRAKQDACMRHVAVWSDEALQGRMFVQVVALCIYQYTENEIFRVKDECESEKMADGKKKNKTVMDSDKKLFNWIDSRSIVRILNWFDAYEQTTVSEKLKRKRWSSPQTARDKLFLGKLGVIPQDKAS